MGRKKALLVTAVFFVFLAPVFSGNCFTLWTGGSFLTLDETHSVFVKSGAGLISGFDVQERVGVFFGLQTSLLTHIRGLSPFTTLPNAIEAGAGIGVWLKGEKCIGLFEGGVKALNFKISLEGFLPVVFFGCTIDFGCLAVPISFSLRDSFWEAGVGVGFSKWF